MAEFIVGKSSGTVIVLGLAFTGTDEKVTNEIKNIATSTNAKLLLILAILTFALFWQ
jgi:hypothetical protein